DIVAHIDAAEAERARLADDVGGEIPLPVPFEREGRDLLGGEGGRHLLNGALVLVQLELRGVHMASSPEQVAVLAASRPPPPVYSIVMPAQQPAPHRRCANFGYEACEIWRAGEAPAGNGRAGLPRRTGRPGSGGGVELSTCP